MSRILNPKVLFGVVLVIGAMVFSKLFAPVPLPGIQLPAEPVPIGGGITVPNTLIHTLLADVTLIIIALLATRQIRANPDSEAALIPSGMQNFVEWVVETFMDLSETIAGDRARQWFPIVMTIFLLVLVANWWELVPGVDSVGVVEPPHGDTGFVMEHVGPFYIVTANEVAVEHHEEEGKGEEAGHELPTTEEGEEVGILLPFLRATATDLNFTFALAIISMVMVQYYGVQALGLGYFSKFLNLKGGVMGFIVGLIETVSEFAKVISFSFRLFGNIFAGQVLLFIMAFLVPWLLPVPFYGLELFVGFIQAFIFAVLTLAFFATAVVSHDEH